MLNKDRGHTDKRMRKLVEIVARLRAPGGCSWDRKQTHSSLVPYLLEEAWEVIDCIEEDKIDFPLKEELGDLLLQIALHAQLADEDGRFSMDEVIESISEKIVNRHPHVFGERKKDLSDAELKKQWEAIKSGERKRSSIGEDLPASAPALLNALTIGQRAANLGFDWENSWDVLSKVEEELSELNAEMRSENRERMEEELGDLLFTIANLARFYDINPEIALKKGNRKFLKRFALVEKAVEEARKDGTDLSREEMENKWNQSKSAD